MQPRRGNRALRVILSTTSLVLPAITLVPLGSLWLWEHGYVLHWAAMALVLVGFSMGLQWWLLRDPSAISPLTVDVEEPPASATDRESVARRRLDAYIASLTPDVVSGEQGLRDLAIATINLVAQEMHPGEVNPHWNFTVPEALLVAERVAARLRPVVIDSVPLGDQLTVRQVLRLYEWRGAVDWAERAYDVWRIVRLLNPVAAITNEARERLTKKLYTSLKDEFTVRLAQGYVREVGTAAIDLYSGRLRVGRHGEKIVDKNATATDPSASDLDEASLNRGRSSDATRGFSWGRLGTQAKSASKFAARAVFRRKR